MQWLGQWDKKKKNSESFVLDVPNQQWRGARYQSNTFFPPLVARKDAGAKVPIMKSSTKSKKKWRPGSRNKMKREELTILSPPYNIRQKRKKTCKDRYDDKKPTIGSNP